METPLSLPLAASDLPEAIRKFGDPAAPMPARMMASKGMVPVQGANLLILMVQLAHDSEEPVRKSAIDTLSGMPEGVRDSAIQQTQIPAILDGAAKVLKKVTGVLSGIVRNPFAADETIILIAKTGNEALTELIAENEQRLLKVPAIIEALYTNGKTRMSTADRLIELCARNGVTLDIPCFEAHAEAIKGQLIPESTAEPLPTDNLFQRALEEDADEDAIEGDGKDGEETVSKKFIPLQTLIREMSLGEKIRFTILGDAAARDLLVRDPNKLVAVAAINSPKMRDNEVEKYAASKEVCDDVLRVISRRKSWTRHYSVKRALVFNPKTPVAIGLPLLKFMRDNDIKALSKSRDVQGPLKQAAVRRMRQKEEKNKK